MATQAQSGSRLKEFETAIQWLVASGLVHQVFRVTKPNLPLSGYQDNVFKLFFLDVGLLNAKTGLTATVLLEGNRLFTEFKGALTEQYVLQQLLVCQSNPIFYWGTEKVIGSVFLNSKHIKFANGANFVGLKGTASNLINHGSSGIGSIFCCR